MNFFFTRVHFYRNLLPFFPDVTRMSVYFTFYGPSGNFLVDDVIVTKLSDNVNWKKMADARIEKYRKSDINIKYLLTYDIIFKGPRRRR